MREIDSKKMTKIICITGTIAMIVFLYIVTTFFRLDWVRYDTVSRDWKIESMLCKNLPPALTIRFYNKHTTNPDFAIHFDETIFDQLKQKPERTVEVNRKLTGYLREWDYGIIIPLTIAEKTIAAQAYISQIQSENCTFQTTDELFQKASNTRRKMR